MNNKINNIQHTYRDKYLKYGSAESTSPSSNIWLAKYLKYKTKYLELKKNGGVEDKSFHLKHYIERLADCNNTFFLVLNKGQYNKYCLETNKFCKEGKNEFNVDRLKKEKFYLIFGNSTQKYNDWLDGGNQAPSTKRKKNEDPETQYNFENVIITGGNPELFNIDYKIEIYPESNITEYNNFPLFNVDNFIKKLILKEDYKKNNINTSDNEYYDKYYYYIIKKISEIEKKDISNYNIIKIKFNPFLKNKFMEIKNNNIMKYIIEYDNFLLFIKNFSLNNNNLIDNIKYDINMFKLIINNINIDENKKLEDYINHIIAKYYNISIHIEYKIYNQNEYDFNKKDNFDNIFEKNINDKKYYYKIKKILYSETEPDETKKIYYFFMTYFDFNIDKLISDRNKYNKNSLIHKGYIVIIQMLILKKIIELLKDKNIDINQIIIKERSIDKKLSKSIQDTYKDMNINEYYNYCNYYLFGKPLYVIENVYNTKYENEINKIETIIKEFIPEYNINNIRFEDKDFEDENISNEKINNFKSQFDKFFKLT